MHSSSSQPTRFFLCFFSDKNEQRKISLHSVRLECTVTASMFAPPLTVHLDFPLAALCRQHRLGYTSWPMGSPGTAARRVAAGGVSDSLGSSLTQRHKHVLQPATASSLFLPSPTVRIVFPLPALCRKHWLGYAGWPRVLAGAAAPYI
jgi:hypothetical protein